MNLSISLSLGSVRAAPLDFIWYGQSNSLNHTLVSSSPPTPSAGTQLWDPNTSAWITPTGNGMITFLNAMQAATGRTCRAVYGGQSGVNIAALQKGDASGNYTNLLARVAASGINPAFFIWHQGEGDANTATPSLGTYRTALNSIHTNVAADTGKTVSSLPLILSSLGRATDASFNQPNSSWAIIQDALVNINTAYANMHYSHSNVPNPLSPDGIHWTGAGYATSGAQYARTVQQLMGLQSTRPRWFATAAARDTVTTTDVTVVHSMGTDFTPTSGITGFEVSNDNGASWVSATGARVNATTIRLTHADLGTVERLIRYQYGKTPDITAPVVDNGSLNAPLSLTTTNLVAAGAV